MKVFLVFVLVIMSLVGCKKKEDQTSTASPTTKQVAPAVTREERKAEALSEVKKTATENATTGTRVNLSSLSSYKLDDLYVDYFGLPKKKNKKAAGNPTPAYVDVSFEKIMGHLYSKKVNFEKCKKDGSCKEATDTVLEQMPILYKDYMSSDKQKMSLKTFIGIADSKVVKAKQSLDWGRVCKHYQPLKDPQKLNAKKCKLLQEVISKIKGKDMIAYGMTELLPSAEGRLNVLYLDLLLQNAGAEFLYYVPALGDELASLGFYQFTMYALRKDDEATEGASVINSFVKDGGEKIHDSVVYLHGHEHHVAAFYFAVHNLSRLVFSLSKGGLEILSKRHLNYQDEMVMYVAAAHHAPGTAHKRTVKWVNGGMKSRLLFAYSGSSIHTYAIKTKGNLLAVYRKT